MAETTDTPVAHRHLILIASMMAMFMAAIEVTIVATAMPTIIAELGGFSQFGWVFSIYLLAQAVTVPVYGRLADLWGRKRVFFIGTSLFLLGSVLCGFSTHMGWLILFRALQGLGAGAITPLTAIIIADVYQPKERANIQGWLSGVWGVSAIIGPLTGAWIVQHFNWALIFWVNVPIGLLSMLMLARWFTEPHRQPGKKINLTGSGWLMLTVAGLLTALLQAEALGHWIVLPLLLAASAGYALLRHEKQSAEPLFPLALWQNRAIVAGNAGNLLTGAAMMGISAFLPTWIQGVKGGTPLQAGSALAMMSIGWPLAATLCGRLMQRTSYRFTAQTGSLLLITGMAMLLILHRESSVLYAGASAFVIGTGMGMTTTTFLLAVQNEADYAIRGICTASAMFCRMTGSALGTAVMGAVLNDNLMARLPDHPDPVQQVMSPAQRHALDPISLRHIVDGIADSLHWVFVVSLVMALLCLVVARLIPARRPE